MFILFNSTGKTPSDGIFADVTMPMNYDSKRYIKMRITNVYKKYYEDNVKVTTKSFPMQKCKQQFFDNTDYERQFYSLSIEKGFYYCG